jgi:Tfp pilus assembly protein PilF/TolB-like protein
MLLLAAARAAAQCPNGRPPPCQSGAPAARRALPALNQRTWIVVPFTNTTKSAEVDWLRDASVNLLSMDMGRWTDVNVVPDKRVADLLRELPASRRAGSLTLNDGLDIARRAGAGMLVMGDFLKAGNGVRIAASVFDVRNGTRVRSLTHQSVADSLLTAFGPVARGVLAVPPPPDAKTSEVGTTSLDAYQAYLLGSKALFRYDLKEARAQLERALSLDSTFALAHLQYSLMLTWGEPVGAASLSRRHALAAQRLGASLPKRDRMLMDAQVASSANDNARMCEIARVLVAQDSTDVQALNMLGECSYHDNTVDVSPSDSMVGQYRNSWNTALRAFARILVLDPSYLGAFEHVFDILQAPNRGGLSCPPGVVATAAPLRDGCRQWTAVVLRRGDSLVVTPVRNGLNDNTQIFAQRDTARIQMARFANLAAAQRLAEQWLAADRSSAGARNAMARVYQAQGNIVAADSMARMLSPFASAENFATIRLRMELAAKRGRGFESRAMFDSLVKAIPDAPGIDAGRGAMELMFGRSVRFERAGLAAAARLGPAAVAYQREVVMAMYGVPRPGLVAAESAFFASMGDSACNRSCRFQRVIPTLAFSPHVPQIPAAVLDSASSADGRLVIAYALAKGDTAELRKGAVNQEVQARANISQGLGEFGWSLIAAGAYLQLHDTTAAMRVTRFFVDTAMAYMPVTSGAASGIVATGAAVLWPRAMLLRADLARATGNKSEALYWYRRVLDLWADADAELRPTLDRIRAAIAALDTKA